MAYLTYGCTLCELGGCELEQELKIIHQAAEVEEVECFVQRDVYCEGCCMQHLIIGMSRHNC